MSVSCVWRGDFENTELNRLHGEAFEHPPLDASEWDWKQQVHQHSLGWVVARQDAALVGFVNVPWDGFTHAWLQDTMVAADVQRRGIGKELIAVATGGARDAGCEWLHVDFDDHLRSFYFDACGFTPTNAGLIALR